MIEKIVKDYLKAELQIPVYTEKQENHPEEYIIIERTGGGEENMILDAVVAIQAHAGSMYRAAAINDTVKDKMSKMTKLDAVSKVELNSSYNFTDTQKKQYRYQAIYNIIYFEE